MGVQARNPFENNEMHDDELTAAARASAADLVDDDLDPIELDDIHHVAIAVEDLDEAIGQYRDLFGITVETREVLADEDVEVAVLTVAGSRLQLMAPASDDSWLVEFLDGQASGLNHVGLTVADCATALDELGRRGWDLVDEEPKAGPAGSRTAYVHPPDQPGTLVQLVQPLT